MSSGWRPWILPNSLQCIGQPHNKGQSGPKCQHCHSGEALLQGQVPLLYLLAGCSPASCLSLRLHPHQYLGCHLLSAVVRLTEVNVCSVLRLLDGPTAPFLVEFWAFGEPARVPPATLHVIAALHWTLVTSVWPGLSYTCEEGGRQFLFPLSSISQPSGDMELAFCVFDFDSGNSAPGRHIISSGLVRRR